MNKNTLRAILIHLFGAVLAVCVFYAALFTVLNITLKNSGNIDSAFYNALADELTNELETYAPSTGVDESFFAQSFDRAEFETHTRDYITACFNGSDRPDVRKDVKEKFYTRLCEYADNEGYMLTDDIMSALTNLADICADKYCAYSSGSITGLLFSYLGKFYRMFDRYALILYTALALMMAVCVWGLWRVTDNKKRYSRFTVVLTASALMCGVAPLWVLLSKFTERIGITSAALKGYITGLTNGVLYGALICAAVLAVLAFAIFTLGVLITKHEQTEN